MMWGDGKRQPTVAGEYKDGGLACEQIYRSNVSFGYLQEAEGVCRDIYFEGRGLGREVSHDEQHFIFMFAQEGEVTVGIEDDGLWIGVHQVEELSLRDGFLALGDVQDGAIEGTELKLGDGEGVGSKVAAAECVQHPIVEDGGATVSAAESFAVHTAFAQFLSGINE